MNSILAIENLGLKIGVTTILNDITFQVESGQMLGIVGPNGSGKTSLFNCISGFNAISSGKLSFENRDITRFSADDRALQGLGRVFQNFGIFRDMTLLENLLVALESREPFWSSVLPNPARYKRRCEQALHFLSEVGLQDKAMQKAGSLSGGQMRLLEIIRTLAFGAKVFLLDEPTAGVSPRMKDDIIAILRKLKALGKTVLMIEHDIGFIQSFAERIIVLDSGRVFLDDLPQKVISDTRLQDLYFGKAVGS